MEKTKIRIPVVDVSKISLDRETVSDDAVAEAGKSIYEAISKYGFVHLVNHGIPRDLIEQGFKVSKDFFDLPAEEKKKSAINVKTDHGYVAPDAEVLNRAKNPYDHEMKEAFNINNIEAGPEHPFPSKDSAPEFQAKLLELIKVSDLFTKRLLRCFSIAMGFEAGYLESLYTKQFTNGSHNFTTLRTLYYPPIKDDVAPGTIRLGEHTDYGPMTMLYQDPMGGLEVYDSVNKNWITAVPESEAVLLNLGDIMEIMTNGRLPATLHRVTISEDEVVKRRARQSLVYFINFDHEAMITPIEDAGKEVHPGNIGKVYKPTNNYDYLTGQLALIRKKQ